MNYKTETKRTYNRYPDLFDEKFDRHFNLFVRPEAEAFLRFTPGNIILDLGSGPGNHAVYFKDQGYDVTCVDNSRAMVSCCRKKGLTALYMDIESLDFPDQTFDGIWAYASLLHIPKERGKLVIPKLARLLRPNGTIGLALKEGEGEGFETHASYPQTQRWFTYYSDSEVRELFDPYFSLEDSGKTQVKNSYVFLKYIFRLKK